MTIQDVITLTREKLADEGNDSIWTDAQYLKLVNQFMRRLNGKHYSFARELIDLQPNLVAGETKKYDLPTNFHNKNHFLFLDGVQMEELADNGAMNQVNENTRYNGSYWTYIGADGKEKIELSVETDGELYLLYYKRLDTLLLTDDLFVDDLEMAIENYLMAEFWRKREFFDIHRQLMVDVENYLGRLNYIYLDKIWKMYRKDYDSIMSAGDCSLSLGGGRSCSYSSSGLLLLS